MTTSNRRQSCLDLPRRQPGLRVPELAKALGISEGAVRNDLNALEVEGCLQGVHGGAVLAVQNQFQNNFFMHRSAQNVASKLAIAREASALVRDGDSLLLDSSSTAFYLARALIGRAQLRVLHAPKRFHTCSLTQASRKIGKNV